MAPLANNPARLRPKRPRSLLGPVVLVLAGITALLLQLGRISGRSALLLYAHFWPFVLIGAGIFLAVEWGLDRARAGRAAQPSLETRRVGGGVVCLLILIAVGGAGLRSGERFGLTQSNAAPLFGFDMLHAVGNAHDTDTSLSRTVASDATVTIDNPVGDVVVSGTSSDGQIHIDVHKQVYAWNDTDAAKRERQLQPEISGVGQTLIVRTPHVESGQADLDITVPHGVSLMLTAGRGDVRVSSLQGTVTVNSERGDVDLGKLDGPVSAHLHSSNATFSAHELTGALTLDGHTGDINLSSINGPVLLTGEFFGSTHLEKLAGPITYRTSRTDLQIAQLQGEVDFDTGSSLHADQLTGPVVLMTRDREITLDRLRGSLQLSNTNGGVNVTALEPLGTMDVTNTRGLVDVAIPAGAAFSLSALTRHGTTENDFGLASQKSGDSSQLSGTVHTGGPSIHLKTSDGDITVRQTLASR